MTAQLNTYEIEEVLVRHGFSDGTINADDDDAWRMATEIVQLRTAMTDALSRLDSDLRRDNADEDQTQAVDILRTALARKDND